MKKPVDHFTFDCLESPDLTHKQCLTVLVHGFGQKCTCIYMCFLSQLLIWGPAQISQFPYERRSRASPPCFRALLILSHNLLSRDFDLPTPKDLMPIYGTTILTGLVEQQLARYPDVDWSVGQRVHETVIQSEVRKRETNIIY